MNVEELCDFYKVKNKSQLAKKINYGRSTVHGWTVTGIPLKTQAVLEIITDGKVKADRDSLTT